MTLKKQWLKVNVVYLNLRFMRIINTLYYIIIDIYSAKIAIQLFIHLCHAQFNEINPSTTKSSLP